MKRWVIIAAIPLVLLAGGIIAAKLYFTGERLRALVVPRIEEATRRSVTLGDISLAVFPSIGVEATGFRLSNPPDRTWPNPYFLSLDRLFVDVRLAHQVHDPTLAVQAPYELVAGPVLTDDESAPRRRAA